MKQDTADPKKTIQDKGKQDFGTPESPKCLTGGDGRTYRRKTHKGLPVMSGEEFDRLLATPPSDEEIKVFNFRGYLEDEHGGLWYADALSANLRNGINIWVRGISNHMPRGQTRDSPDTIDQYVLFVKFPTEQRNRDVDFYTQINPLEDERDRLRVLVLAVAEYIQRGMPLEKLEDFMCDAELRVLYGPSEPVAQPSFHIEQTSGNSSD